ncbi:UDP-N-acetylmuramoyl-L-alanine--D-glutamate ligase [Chenggangzhangella methanolivorans]|uniref:UDP-N-acetylmuramoylalanine--D-glutamate ligase n=1 Tax=Chenggangzhangella methanolivorans TaxID=1437009 RepID=A0A9E6R9Z4_9HYPH|nr:UDP-N-acetylmuramoyl-L-alanine--D-glutamate ligase [Chenggangzhangella methanolivorans]QZO00869.1 UDP-N-acetylmuramoyl-L-alanine--D-glutamate ligase [Chenggangzhangella methanolivorans]
MTPATAFKDMKVAVFGLGGSGLATVRSLVAGGADVTAFDDNAASVEKAKAEGLPTGDLREGDFSRFELLVLAPGVPLTHPKPHWSVELAKAAGVGVIGDIQIFCSERDTIAPDAPFVAITGTNGKSTTTALTAHVLREAGWDVQMGGNIGVPVLELAPPAPNRVHVVECSSYQIDLTMTLAPTVGVMLNLSEDHLDRHGTMDGYAGVKERLVVNAKTAVIGVDDERSAAMAKRLAIAGVEVVKISENDPLDLSGARALRGAHNVQNASAVRAVARALGLDDAAILKGFSTFPGLAHRMEISTPGRVVFINDSKATNADSAEKALASFEKSFWILGGKPKTGGIEALVPLLGRVEKAFLVGEASEAFARTLGEHGVAHDFCGTVDKAVEAAAKAAEASADPEPVVLFSPACASFDQFRNFEERGEAFRRAVLGLQL